MSVYIIYAATVFSVLLIGIVTVVLMDHANTRIYREQGYCMDPEFDSYLERWRLRKKTR